MSKYEVKIKLHIAGEMAQWLRLLAAPQRTRVQFPTPRSGSSHLPATPAQRDPTGLPGHPYLGGIHLHRRRHIHKNKPLKIFNLINKTFVLNLVLQLQNFTVC